MIELSLAYLFFSTSVLFFSSNPMILSLILVMFAGVVSLMIHYMFSKWFFFVILLVFLGGMMIMFIYIASLAGNSKIKQMNWSMTIFMFALIFIIFISNFLMDVNQMLWMNNLFSLLSIQVMWFMMIYLLMTLFMVVKMAESFKGPLTKMS